MEAEFFMRQALKLAAADPDEVPVGALIVKDNAVIAQSHNQQFTLQDPTAHAEMLAIRQACKELKSSKLSGCTLFVTLEPCPMCAGAIIASGIERCIFGAFDSQYGCCGSLYALPMDPAFHHRIDCQGGVLEDECSQLLQQFFQQKRKEEPVT